MGASCSGERELDPHQNTAVGTDDIAERFKFDEPLPAWAADIPVQVRDSNGVLVKKEWGKVLPTQPTSSFTGGSFSKQDYAAMLAASRARETAAKSQRSRRKTQEEAAKEEADGFTDAAAPATDEDIVPTEYDPNEVGSHGDSATHDEETKSTSSRADATHVGSPSFTAMNANLNEVGDSKTTESGMPKHLKDLNKDEKITTSKSKGKSDDVANMFMQLTETLSKNSAPPTGMLRDRAAAFHKRMHNLVSPVERDLAPTFTSMLAGYQKGIHVVDLTISVDKAVVLEAPLWEPWAHPSKHFNDSGIAGREGTGKAVAVEIARFRRSRLNAEEDNRRVLLQIGVEKRAGPIKPSGPTALGF